MSKKSRHANFQPILRNLENRYDLVTFLVTIFVTQNPLKFGMQTLFIGNSFFLRVGRKVLTLVHENSPSLPPPRLKLLKKHCSTLVCCSAQSCYLSKIQIPHCLGTERDEEGALDFHTLLSRLFSLIKIRYKDKKQVHFFTSEELAYQISVDSE